LLLPGVNSKQTQPRDGGDWSSSFGKGQALPGINLGKPAAKITTNLANAGYVSSFMGSAKKQNSMFSLLFFTTFYGTHILQVKALLVSSLAILCGNNNLYFPVCVDFAY